MTRTVTICIPPRDDDPDGKAHYFAAVVEDRRVVKTMPVEKPKMKVRAGTKDA